MMEEPWNLGHYQPINLPAASAAHSWNWSSRPSSDLLPLLPAEVQIHPSSRDRLPGSIGNEEALHCEQLSHYRRPPFARRAAMERTIKDETEEEEESYDVGGCRMQMIPVAPPHSFGPLAAGAGEEEAVVSRCMRGNYSLVLPSETISGSSSAAALRRRAEGGGRRATADQFKCWSAAMGAEEKEEASWEANEGRGMKRGASSTTAISAVLKKPRPEGDRSLIASPFKVRKEKLGDRIAALQQLVAPFGKTDTASVLMEAIGYIKFLQDQVETLSVPYLRSSKNSKASYGVFGQEKEERRIDLRSKGLCLVPLSCTTYIANEMFGCNYE